MLPFMALLPGQPANQPRPPSACLSGANKDKEQRHEQAPSQQHQRLSRAQLPPLAAAAAPRPGQQQPRVAADCHPLLLHAVHQHQRCKACAGEEAAGARSVSGQSSMAWLCLCFVGTDRKAAEWRPPVQSSKAEQHGRAARQRVRAEHHNRAGSMHTCAAHHCQSLHHELIGRHALQDQQAQLRRAGRGQQAGQGATGTGWFDGQSNASRGGGGLGRRQQGAQTKTMGQKVGNSRWEQQLPFLHSMLACLRPNEVE